MWCLPWTLDADGGAQVSVMDGSGFNFEVIPSALAVSIIFAIPISNPKLAVAAFKLLFKAKYIGTRPKYFLPVAVRKAATPLSQLR